MARILFILLVSGCSGAAFGLWGLGKWRALFFIFGGEGLAGQFLGIIWRVALYQVGLFGIPVVVFIGFGVLPLKALEVCLCYFAAFMCSIAGERLFAKRSKRIARNAGLLTEEDL